MRYWVIKGNPAEYKWDRYLRAGREENWHSRFANWDLAPGHRIFLWESGSPRRLIGFASLVSRMPKRDAEGRFVFRVRYLTNRLQWMPGIDELRSIPILRRASFLNPGPFGTAYTLTIAQGMALYRAVVAGNPSDHIWRDISGTNADGALPDVDHSANEGSLKLVTHLRRERNPTLVSKKKAQFRKEHGGLFCECCRSDFAQYGRMSDGLFEVHHRRPLGKVVRSTKTSLDDLAVLCSNCHRVIHRWDPMPSVEVLARKVHPKTRRNRDTKSGSKSLDG